MQRVTWETFPAAQFVTVACFDARAHSLREAAAARWDSGLKTTKICGYREHSQSKIHVHCKLLFSNVKSKKKHYNCLLMNES